MTDASTRIRPNILVTGTPCVGKTATASLIAEKLHMRHANIGDIIQRNKCYLEYDEALQTHMLDEDKLLDILEAKYFDNEDDIHEDEYDTTNATTTTPGTGIQGNIVADYHACEIFPERWFDLVLVLRVDTHILYDRLMQRGYNEAKRSQNMECEIMQVVRDEAMESYAKEIVIELTNNTIDDMEQNVDRVVAWYRQWIADHSDIDE